MKLRCYEVEGLAQLGHEKVVFRHDAPNLIIGPNEAGKSHLMLGLCGMFFGLDNPERMKPWHGPAAMRGTLDFEDEDGNPVRLERDYTSDTVTVHAGGERWSAQWEGKAAGKERFLQSLEAWLGFRDPSIFTSTTFIRQAEMITAEIKGIAPEIKRLITGTMEAGYDRVLKDLTSSLDGLRRAQGVRRESQLERQQETLRQLEGRRRAARERQERIVRLRQIRDRLSAEIEQRTTQEARLQEQMDLIGDLDGLETRQGQLRTQLQRLDGQLESLQRGQTVLEAALRERDRYAAAAGTTKNELFELDRNVRDAEAALERLSNSVSTAKPLRPRFLSKTKEQPPLSDLSVEEITERIWQARTARDSALRHMNVIGVPQALDLRDRYDSAEVEVVKAQAFLEALGDEAELVAHRADVTRDLNDVTERIGHITGSDLTGDRIQNRDACRKTLVSLQDAIAVLKNDAADVERKLQLEGEGEEDDAQIERELRRIRAHVDAIREQVAAHELAIGVLKECIIGFQDHYLDGVMSDASSMFNDLTNGRYLRVHLRDGDLEPLVDTAERTRIPSAQLSRGAREQLYFVLRVALARTLANDRGLPMILDDPYVNFDPQRLKRTVAILQTLAQHTQIIFFTADPRYEEWFEPVLRLEAEAPRAIVQDVA